MALQSNVDKANNIRSVLVSPNASSQSKRRLRKKIEVSLKRTILKSGEITHWLVPMDRSITSGNLENLCNILDLIEGSRSEDLSDIKDVYDMIFI